MRETTLLFTYTNKFFMLGALKRIVANGRRGVRSPWADISV